MNVNLILDSAKKDTLIDNKIVFSCKRHHLQPNVLGSSSGILHRQNSLKNDDNE